MPIRPESKAMFETEFVQTHVNKAIEVALSEHAENVRNGLMGNLLFCPFESPLEMAFFAWWHTMAQNRAFSELQVHLQQEVVVGGHWYRVDFEIRRRDHAVEQAGAALGLPVPRIAIEVDGHEFHERTKEQVIWRDSRDRALQTAGWVVLHVSGSAFHRDPETCVWGVALDAQNVFWKYDTQVLALTAPRRDGADS
jgi:very-short-patch-repair endonuclease